MLRIISKTYFNLVNHWRKLSNWIKLPAIILIALFMFVGVMYLVAVWYQHKHASEPLKLGTTFIQEYAESFGLDPHYTLDQIFNDLGMRDVRLVSYWEDIEANQGTYDFSSLDWQMAMAEKYNANVTLAIGLRQPRWPECHAPSWVDESNQNWKNQLNEFMTSVVNRYKNSKVLVSYQLENEYFLGAFGECGKYGSDRERLINEYNLVKNLDPSRPIILSLADNYTFPVRGPVPDYYGVSVYKRVFDFTVTKRYIEYPFPSWYYSARSGLMEIFHGSSSILHELQTEPWGPDPIMSMSIEEQDKTMNAELLAERIKYAEDTGFRTIYTWGAEWWLWRKDKVNDPSLWDTAKQAVIEARASNSGL